jgi:hypothetical protein
VSTKPGPLTKLPVRCDNGHFYLTPASVLSIGTGIRATLRNIRYDEPCPVCGDRGGVIEDGEYYVPASFRQRLRMAWSVLRRGYV